MTSPRSRADLSLAATIEAHKPELADLRVRLTRQGFLSRADVDVLLTAERLHEMAVGRLVLGVEREKAA